MQELQLDDFKIKNFDKTMIQFYFEYYNTAFRGYENMQQRIVDLQKFYFSFISAIVGAIAVGIEKKIFTVDLNTVSIKLLLYGIILVLCLIWIAQICLIHKKIELKKSIILALEKDLPYAYFTHHFTKTGKTEILFKNTDFYVPIIYALLLFILISYVKLGVV
jgi:hypothetical protein